MKIFIFSFCGQQYEIFTANGVGEEVIGGDRFWFAEIVEGVIFEDVDTGEWETNSRNFEKILVDCEGNDTAEGVEGGRLRFEEMVEAVNELVIEEMDGSKIKRTFLMTCLAPSWSVTLIWRINWMAPNSISDFLNCGLNDKAQITRMA